MAAAAICVIGTATGASPAEGNRNLTVQQAAPRAGQSQRLALVIGNSAYKEAALSNPVNDAQAMAQALRQAGFTVLLHTDVDRRGLLAAVRDFGDRLRQGGFGLFYFAGHGMQIKGRNYLIPVGADIQREDEVSYAALDAQAVLDKMEAAGNGANLMILDACRNNPFARSFRSSAQGLAQMDAPVGTLVAFATAPGTVASDGQGQNGLYTQHLLEAMRKPGTKVEDVFKQVRAGVRRDSVGKQIPWEATSLEGDLYFVEPPPPAPAAPPPPAAAAPAAIADGALDDTFWQAIRDSREVTVIRGYLTRFPRGQHVEEAWQRVAMLAAPAAGPAAMPPAAPLSPAPNAAASSASASTPGVALPAVPVGGGAIERHGAASDRVAAERPHEQAQRTESTQLPVIPLEDGIRVGDRWNFQRIDRQRGEVSGSFTWRVAGVDAQGVPYLEGDDGYRDPVTLVMRRMLLPAAFGVPARPGRAVWWAEMNSGEERTVTMQPEVRAIDGMIVKAEQKVRFLRRGTERIRVPAGEFEAWRLDLEGELVWQEVGGWSPRQLWNMQLWYVPELRGFAAIEGESHFRRFGTWAKEYNTYRNELTSFELVPPRVATR